MSRPEIRWCTQNTEEFLVVSHDLTLYKLEKRKTAETLPLSGVSASVSQSFKTSVVSNRHLSSVPLKCWHWHNDRKLVAVGENSGKVTLVSPYEESNDPYDGREFAPRHSRICRDVRWCPTKSYDHLLAAAYDKYHRNDSAVLIWDALHGSVPSSHQELQGSDQSSLTRKLNRQMYPEPSGAAQVGAVQELGPGESGFSLAWFPQDRTLAAGLSNKYIKVFDTRSDYSSRQPLTIFTRAVMGLRLNPFDDRKLLSFHDNYVFVWDLRNNKHEKPLVAVTAPLPQKILQAEWDPTRSNVFSCLYSSSSFVNLFNLQKISGDDTELSYVERHVLPKFVDTDSVKTSYDKCLSSFSWHPTKEGEILAVTMTGSVSLTSVSEWVCVDWDSKEKFVTNLGRNIMEFEGFADASLQADISHQMHWRATMGYGLNMTESGAAAPSLKHNIDVLNETRSKVSPKVKEMLSWTWSWMERIKNLSGECSDDWNYSYRYCGVIEAWEKKLNNGDWDRSVRQEMPIDGLESQGRETYHQIYVSRNRSRILRLCGWGTLSGEGPTVENCLKELTATPLNFTRAAAIAMFCLKLQYAVELLIKAADAKPRMEHLQLVAMALAGYKGASEGGQASIWQRLCSSILPKVQDPYLKAIFLFLSGRLEPDTNYGSLLALQELPLYDRVAFTAIHFADHPLEEIYARFAKEAIKKGDLFGLLLTGLSNQDDPMELLQNYVDETGDVQSASLLLIHSGCIPTRASVGRMPSMSSFSASNKMTVAEELTDLSGWQMVESYFGLLNGWQLWHTRAHTEALISQKQDPEATAKLKSQISIICTFCNRTIFSTMGRHRGRGTFKSGACPNPNCKKPLPRCVLCRRHMGTPLPKEHERSDQGRQKKFDSWFTWCQSCRHGGHAVHMREWFSINSECPVTGCACKCAQLDTKEKSA